MKYNFDKAISDELLKLILSSFRRMHAMHKISYSNSDAQGVREILQNINTDRTISLEVIRRFQLNQRNNEWVFEHFSDVHLSIYGALLNV